MKKRIGVMLILLVMTFIIVGCSSSDSTNPVNNTQEVNPPRVPDSLKQSTTTTQSININTQLMATSTSYDSKFQELFNFCYSIPGIYDNASTYFKSKINEIIKLDETISNYTVENDYYLEASGGKGEFVKTNNKYDIYYSTDLEARYDQQYDVKYTLKDGNNTIDAVIYKNITGTKVNYLDKYTLGTEEQTLQFIYDATNSEKIGMMSVYFENGINFINIKEGSSTRKVKVIMVDSYSSYPQVVSFAALEDRDVVKTSAAFFVNYGTDSRSLDGSEPSWVLPNSEVLNKMQNYKYEAPLKLGIFKNDGTSALRDTSNFGEIYETGYPTKEETMNYHKNSSVNYGMLYDVDFNQADLSFSQGKSLVEILEQNNAL